MVSDRWGLFFEVPLMRLASIKRLSVALVFAVISSVASGDLVAPKDIYVVDGDTIEVHGQRIRLIDFDAPRWEATLIAAYHRSGSAFDLFGGPRCGTAKTSLWP